MQQKVYDTLVLVGRFQPVHNAHVEIIRRASVLAHKVVIVIGSASQPRTYKNPFTVLERCIMLKDAVVNGCNDISSVFLESVEDNPYNDQEWAISVQSVVNRHVDKGDKVGIIGHEKDESSFYLKLFPQWIHEEVELIEPLHATDIRDLYFKEDCNMKYLKSVVPEEVFSFLDDFEKTPSFKQIVDERNFIKSYKKQYESLSYPPIFVTSDVVLIQSGHVLLIKRKACPGKGLYALPGGFVNAYTDKSVQSAAIRELKEETGIKVPVPVLNGNIKGSRVFDAVDRSARGRTITHAFAIVLPDGELPKVKGLDDAEKAMWIPISEITGEQMFEDHIHIIRWALGTV